MDVRLEFGILGPLEVRAGGTPVHVGGPRQRALLALLLCHANQVVSRDELIEELLAGQPAKSVQRMLRVQVSRLREALTRGDAPPRLLARPPGYVLRIEPGELDLEVFEQRVAAGRDALARGDPGRAAVLLGEAESLWRGRPLADLEFEPFAWFEIQRLQALRLAATDDRIEAELELGHHGAVCPELERLVAEHPLRERLRGQLMLALYRSGRQAEALEAYRAGRLVLVEELGVEPGPGLRRMHEQVLAADPALDLPAPAGGAPRTLPRDTAAFTGRGRELAQLLGAIGGQAATGAGVGVHAIDGMAGIGKTAFAVHAAHQLAAGFPDGQFFLPLHAHTPGQRPMAPADALASLLLTAGLAPQQIPPGLEARAARWRDHVAGKKILLLLDDAGSHEQIRPLFPGTVGSVVLITSRRRLTALHDVAVVSLDVLPADEAAALLTRLAGRPGLGAGDAAVGELTRLCGYLPLAVGMLASQLRHHPAWTAAQLAASLAAARDRLALMHAENLSVAATFDLSYADLTDGQQRLFRRLGLIPGPGFDAYTVAALEGTSLGIAQRDLGELYDQHLLAEHAPGRYQLHDLLREHARDLAATDKPAESDAATGRLFDYYLHTALAAGRYFDRFSIDRRPRAGGPPAHAPDLSTFGRAAAWLEAERANLLAAADYAATSGRFRHAIAIPAAMSGFLAVRGLWDQSAALHRSALATALQAGDRLGEADALSTLGELQREAGDYPAAAATLARALALHRDIGDQPGHADALNRLGFVHVLTGDYPAAVARYEEALALARSAGDRRAQGWAFNGLALVQQLTGDHAAAASSLQRALALFGDLDDLHGQARALNSLGVVQQEIGDYPAAAASQRQALALFRDLGHRFGEAQALNDLGLVQQETGDHPAAAASHQQALELLGDLGNLLGQAEALNRLGELSLRTSATGQARDQHARALAIARDISAAPEEARALEGLGHTHLQEGNPGQAAAHLQQALTIYRRIGAPAARRVQQTLHNHPLTSATPRPQPAAPHGESDQPVHAAAPREASDTRRSGTRATREYAE